MLHVLVAVAPCGNVEHDRPAAFTQPACQLLFAVAGDRHRHHLTFLIDRHHADAFKAHDRLDERTGVARRDVVADIERRIAAAAELDGHGACRVDQLRRHHHAVGADRRRVLGLDSALHIDKYMLQDLQKRIERVGLVRQLVDFSEIFHGRRRAFVEEPLLSAFLGGSLSAVIHPNLPFR